MAACLDPKLGEGELMHGGRFCLLLSSYNPCDNHLISARIQADSLMIMPA